MPPKYIDLTCDRCGCKFQRKEAEYRHSVKIGTRTFYCSQKCRAIASRRKVPLVCAVCGASFMRHYCKYVLAAGEDKFCSRSCRQRFFRDNRQTINCPECEKPFSAKPSVIDRKPRIGNLIFCSGKCKRQHEKVRFTCDGCGDEFLVSPGTLNSRKRSGNSVRFCSNACRTRSKVVTLKCELCGAPFERNDLQVERQVRRRGHAPRFCSYECSHKAASLKPSTQEMVDLICPECGNSFQRTAHSVRATRKKGASANYCSVKCNTQAHGKVFRKPKQYVALNCATCGTTFHREACFVRAAIKKGQKNFCCSRSCSSALPRREYGKPWAISGFRNDIQMFVRSTWEANVIRVFRAIGWTFEYEPRAFRVGEFTYRPDFLVNSAYWVEVKGWMTDDSAAKIMAFRRTHPDQLLVVVDGPVYRAIEQEWAARIPEWEYASSSTHSEAA